MTRLDRPCQFPTSPPITLGAGRLCWPRAEHITGRYGLITLTDTDNPITPASITPCIGLKRLTDSRNPRHAPIDPPR